MVHLIARVRAVWDPVKIRSSGIAKEGFKQSKSETEKKTAYLTESVIHLANDG